MSPLHLPHCPALACPELDWPLHYLILVCPALGASSKSVYLVKHMSVASIFVIFAIGNGDKQLSLSRPAAGVFGLVLLWNTSILGGQYLICAPQKALSVRLHSKSHQKVLMVKIHLFACNRNF